MLTTYLGFKDEYIHHRFNRFTAELKENRCVKLVGSLIKINPFATLKGFDE
jgi:hypothetical protein